MDKKAILLDAQTFMETHVPSTRPKEGYLKHVLGVREYALLLAQEYHADAFIMEMTAYLHDVGAYVGENHDQESAKIAQDYLGKTGLDEPIIGWILSCILHHSTHSAEQSASNLEDQLFRDADGLSFLKNNYEEFYQVQTKRHNQPEAVQISVAKINAMYDKITSKKGKELGKPFHQAALKYIQGLQ